jgi:Skp family chaperone for outer membrane proteins
MKKKYLIFIGLAAGSLLFSPALRAIDNFSVGFVNFKVCAEKSKQGAQERNALDALKKQMGETLEKSDKELADLAKKLGDKEYMDGLSPTAEAELNQRFQTLSQEFARYQNQYYQLLNQANYRMLQSLHTKICSASEAVREKNKLTMLLNEDSVFAFAPTLNFTDEVIKQMDSLFETENTEVANIVKNEKIKDAKG